MTLNINIMLAALAIRALQLGPTIDLECLCGLQILPESLHGHGNTIAILMGNTRTTVSLPGLDIAHYGTNTVPVMIKSTKQYLFAELKRRKIVRNRLQLWSRSFVNTAQRRSRIHAKIT
jgi:hypothetical protein